MFFCWFFVILCLLALYPLYFILRLYVKSRVTYIVHKKSSDSVILITGCDSGIGKAATERLLKEGFFVISTIFTKQGKEILESFSESINASDRLLIRNVDITSTESVQQLQQFIQLLLKENPSKKLVGLVNNAGVIFSSPIEVQPMPQFQKQIEVNLFGHIRVTQAIIPFLRESKGRIVNTVSIVGRITLPSMGAYSASKFAMESITNCLRMELAPWNISVSAIEPGCIRTPLVENYIENMNKDWDNLLPNAKTLYNHELQNGLKSCKNMLDSATQPSCVADKIYQALTSVSPKTRYLVGKDAYYFSRMALILPDRLLDALITNL